MITYDFYTAELLLWYGTEHERRETVHGSRERKRKPATERMLREHIRDAYRHYKVPVRILKVEQHR